MITPRGTAGAKQAPADRAVLSRRWQHPPIAAAALVAATDAAMAAAVAAVDSAADTSQRLRDELPVDGTGLAASGRGGRRAPGQAKELRSLSRLRLDARREVVAARLGEEVR